MSQAPIVVLLVGLVAGVVLALWAARGRAARSRSDLRHRDLQLQLDELVETLRDEGLAESERSVLEERAALTLRRLEALGGPVTAPAGTTQTAPASARPPAGLVGRHPLLAGTLLGGGMVALVAILIALAFRDTGLPLQPGAAGAPAAPAPDSATEAPEGFRGEPALPPIVAGQVEDLRARIAAAPGELGARRQLIELLLAHEQHFDAFQEASALLEREPQDPVAHYGAGFVRFLMGQVPMALDHLRQAVAADPAYSQARLVQGLILLQTGDRAGALETWRAGVDAVGGSEPRLEHLISLTEQGLDFDQVVSRPPPV
ncbi:MAG: hypothetical protein DWQ36_00220 [Acidobacteria bacterium]|nr:MAG: hypothetical protein DWQ30_18370 [Acidobacteriota bacterium]REK12129.1 MAG: hypothetical protein DWQ36_00220 [Acidobacteriota bacterium]